MRFTFLLVFVAVAQPSYAISDQERTVLQRLHAELATLTTIIDEAEQSTNKLDRQQVNYDQLRADLLQIQEGIGDVVNAQRREPRSLPPISGEYR